MGTEQITILISIIALLTSTATAALSIARTGKRDRFKELDIICDQQWNEINSLRIAHQENERARSALASELKIWRANDEAATANLRAGIGINQAKIAETAAVARVAAISATKAQDIATKAAESTEKQLAEIAEVTTGTHNIVNNQRTMMLKTLAALSERVAKQNPDDDAAQLAWHNAMRDVEDDARGD